MGKEQDVHFLIEKQGSEEKEICLERLNERMSQELDAKSGKTTVKKSARPFLKWASICIAIAVIVTLGITLPIVLRSDDASSIRFCTNADYYTMDSDLTLKEYATSHPSKMLYLNGELGFEHVLSQHYKLKNNDETICIYEESISEENTVYIYIVKENYEMDFLEHFKTLCNNELDVNSLNVMWGKEVSTIYAKFKYEGLDYFLQIDEADSADTVENVVNDLLASANN